MDDSRKFLFHDFHLTHVFVAMKTNYKIFRITFEYMVEASLQDVGR